ncbi:tagatose-6-phosphate kinase [Paenibacillus sp. J53TS2]|uniref:1-phosphofructokinase n=1 Tax=Paenibacillus sp. J53TS2 TaxID=2807197 RepID=UPI001B0AE60D|nr:1-phosphofructokinase [Paenibacillus sp. J53TS2]GIP47022.1 tagatose-6-phosphate kinase [Paenibacillus sp. J53TS2]
MRIYTVTLNPSIDYIVEVDGLQLGGLNRMTRDLKLPGGKGINVSRVLKRLGADTTAMGFLGGFTGDFIEGFLRDEAINADFVRIDDGDTRINIKLKHGEETEINGGSPAITGEEANALVEKLSLLRKGDLVILAGSLPPSLPGDFYEQLIRRCRLQGAEFVIDTTGEPLRRALAYQPLLAKPNHHELAELFGVVIETREQLITYGRRLLEEGAQHVLISMAGEGALLITGNEVYHANVPPGKVRNSVGAGDSMIAGFSGTLAMGGDLMEAFRAGVASGSATAFSDDLAERVLIDELRARVSIVKVE